MEAVRGGSRGRVAELSREQGMEAVQRGSRKRAAEPSRRRAEKLSRRRAEKPSRRRAEKRNRDKVAGGVPEAGFHARELYSYWQQFCSTGMPSDSGKGKYLREAVKRCVSLS